MGRPGRLHCTMLHISYCHVLANVDQPHSILLFEMTSRRYGKGFSKAKGRVHASLFLLTGKMTSWPVYFLGNGRQRSTRLHSQIAALRIRRRYGWIRRQYRRPGHRLRTEVSTRPGKFFVRKECASRPVSESRLNTTTSTERKVGSCRCGICHVLCRRGGIRPGFIILHRIRNTMCINSDGIPRDPRQFMGYGVSADGAEVITLESTGHRKRNMRNTGTGNRKRSGILRCRVRARILVALTRVQEAIPCQICRSIRICLNSPLPDRDRVIIERSVFRP